MSLVSLKQWLAQPTTDRMLYFAVCELCAGMFLCGMVVGKAVL